MIYIRRGFDPPSCRDKGSKVGGIDVWDTVVNEQIISSHFSHSLYLCIKYTSVLSVLSNEEKKQKQYLR